MGYCLPTMPAAICRSKRLPGGLPVQTWQSRTSSRPAWTTTFVLRIGDQVPERVKGADGQRVDKDEPIIGRDLNETKVRMIGVFTDEFGIEAEDRAVRQVFHSTPAARPVR